MNPAEKWKADFQFRRKQSLILEAKQLKAGGQTEMRIYLTVRLLGSGCDPLQMTVFTTSI